MLLVATILVHITDPIRIIFLGLSIWMVWSFFPPGWSRLAPAVVAAVSVSVIVGVMLQAMTYTSAERLTFSILVGCVSNLVLVALMVGAAKVFKRFR